MENEAVDSNESIDSQESLDERTSTPSTGEEQTESTPEPQDETTEVATSEQPAEETEAVSRSQERIRELVRGKKEAQEEAEYWKRLAEEPQKLEVGEPDESGYTLDQISASVVNKLNEAQTAQQKKEAALSLKKDIETTIKTYPELDKDDDLAAIVMSVAEKRGISVRAAADRVMTMVREKESQTQKKVLADQASKVGVSAPRGESVANNAPGLNLNQLSEDEKRSNWDKIISNY